MVMTEQEERLSKLFRVAESITWRLETLMTISRGVTLDSEETRVAKIEQALREIQADINTVLEPGQTVGDSGSGNKETMK